MGVSDKNINRFKRAVKKLDSIINEIVNESSDDESSPFVYLDGNNTLHLMSGEAKIGEDDDGDTILVSVELNASGGDW